MLKKVALGIDNFKKLIEDNVYFVDKTLFIKDFMEDGSQVIVLPRPRRFGKTLNMSMLKYFLDNKENSKDLFEGLEISKDKEFFEKHMNKHPLIYISLKEVKKSTWKESFKLLKEMIQKEYERHENVLDSLNTKEKAYYKKVMNNPQESDLVTSLLGLCKFLEKHYEKKVILLIDEYDAPIHKSYIKEYYENAINFFQTFFGSAMKSNDHLHKGLMTGILRVSKESMFSGLNNVDVISILSERYSQYFGFTEEESVKFAETYRVAVDGMKDWYNGYRIGNNMIYNPWSIINYVKNEGKLKEYWVNTSSNDLVYKLIRESGKELKKKFLDLLEGKEIEISVDEHISLKDIDLKREVNVISLLLFTGYLTWTTKEMSEQGEQTYRLKIPNAEVKGFFRKMVKKLTERMSGLNEIVENIDKWEWERFKYNFEDLVKRTFSYYDVTEEEPEKFYHAFVMGVMVSMDKEYEVRSNREAGLGRYDLTLKKKDNSQVAIMEFKRVIGKEKIEEVAEEAIRQIEKREYEKEYRGMKIKKVGIAFKGKDVKVAYR